MEVSRRTIFSLSYRYQRFMIAFYVPWAVMDPWALMPHSGRTETGHRGGREAADPLLAPPSHPPSLRGCSSSEVFKQVCSRNRGLTVLEKSASLSLGQRGKEMGKDVFRPPALSGQGPLSLPVSGPRAAACLPELRSLRSQVSDPKPEKSWAWGAAGLSSFVFHLCFLYEGWFIFFPRLAFPLEWRGLVKNQAEVCREMGRKGSLTWIGIGILIKKQIFIFA